jgi:hypothetical protein
LRPTRPKLILLSSLGADFNWPADLQVELYAPFTQLATVT